MTYSPAVIHSVTWANGREREEQTDKHYNGVFLEKYGNINAYVCILKRQIMAYNITEIIYIQTKHTTLPHN